MVLLGSGKRRRHTRPYFLKTRGSADAPSRAKRDLGAREHEERSPRARKHAASAIREFKAAAAEEVRLASKFRDVCLRPAEVTSASDGLAELKASVAATVRPRVTYLTALQWMSTLSCGRAPDSSSCKREWCVCVVVWVGCAG